MMGAAQVAAAGERRSATVVVALAAAAWLSPTSAWCAGRVPAVRHSLGAFASRPAARAWQGQTQHAAVHQLTESYDRGSSAVLVRCVDNPTRASLDFAAWDGNGMCDAPLDTPPPSGARVSFGALAFGGALVAGSAVDAIGDTPLLDSESRRPMSWRPAIQYLATTDPQASQVLAAGGWLVEGETWGGERPTRPYQQVRRLFLREGRAGHEAWVEIEFQHGVDIVTGVTDDDGDGFAEVYGQLRPQFLGARVATRLTRDYAGRALGPRDIRAWERQLVEAWYGPYYAASLDASDREVVPNVRSKPGVRSALQGVTLSNPAAAIRGERNGTPMHTFVVVGCPRR